MDKHFLYYFSQIFYLHICVVHEKDTLKRMWSKQFFQWKRNIQSSSEFSIFPQKETRSNTLQLFSFLVQSLAVYIQRVDTRQLSPQFFSFHQNKTKNLHLMQFQSICYPILLHAISLRNSKNERYSRKIKKSFINKLLIVSQIASKMHFKVQI